MAGSTQLMDILLNKYGLAVFTAIITGVISYIAGVRLEEKKNKKTLKRLSWDMEVDSSLVEVKGELREQVQVHYAGEAVKDLTTVTLRITNTGGAPVLNEFVRFAFPARARMLEAALDPVPEPELDVAEVTGDDTPAGNRRFRLGHLEPEQSVQFRFISDGGDWANWDGIHPKNEEGGVDFQRGDVSRVKEDQEHVRPFVAQAVLLILVQLGLALNIGNYFDGVIQFARLAVTLLLAGLMLPHVLPVARLAESIAIRYAMGRNERAQSVGGKVLGHVLQAGSVGGDIVVSSPSARDEESDDHQSRGQNPNEEDG